MGYPRSEEIKRLELALRNTTERVHRLERVMREVLHELEMNGAHGDLYHELKYLLDGEES